MWPPAAGFLETNAEKESDLLQPISSFLMISLTANGEILPIEVIDARAQNCRVSRIAAAALLHC